MSSKAASVSFTNDIAPILSRKCISCHDDKKAKGGLRVHTYAALLAGAKEELVLVPRKPEESTMYKLLTASDPDDRMPQKDDPLPKEQIELIRQWIAEGARFDGSDSNANIQVFIPGLADITPPNEYPASIAVVALAFNSAGDLLASSGYHEILIWDAQTGRLKQRIQSLPERVQDLVYTPGGKWLVAATGTPGRLGQVNLVNTETGKPEAVLATAPDFFLSIAFNADATKLAAAGADNSIRVIDVAARKELLKIEQHADWVMSARFHPNGTNLLSASRDKTARVIRTETGELDSTYQGHTEAIFSIAANEKGDRVFTAGRDKKVHIWEPHEAKKMGEISDSEQDIYKLIAEKNSLFVCGADKSVRQYEIADKPKLVRIYSGHRDYVYSLALSTDGKRLASGSFDGEIRLWNVESGEMVIAFAAAPGATQTRASK